MSQLIRVSDEFYNFIKQLSKSLNISIVEATKVLSDSLVVASSDLSNALKDKKIIIVIVNTKKQLILYNDEFLNF
ncbi:MAG: hypothetical protein QXJ14_02710 [Candidatus Aenigmatarchaeota archaeon]